MITLLHVLKTTGGHAAHSARQQAKLLSVTPPISLKIKNLGSLPSRLSVLPFSPSTDRPIVAPAAFGDCLVPCSLCAPHRKACHQGPRRRDDMSWGPPLGPRYRGGRHVKTQLRTTKQNQTSIGSSVSRNSIPVRPSFRYSPLLDFSSATTTILTVQSA